MSFPSGGACSGRLTNLKIGRATNFKSVGLTSGRISLRDLSELYSAILVLFRDVDVFPRRISRTLGQEPESTTELRVVTGPPSAASEGALVDLQFLRRVDFVVCLASSCLPSSGPAPVQFWH